MRSGSVLLCDAAYSTPANLLRTRRALYVKTIVRLYPGFLQELRSVKGGKRSIWHFAEAWGGLNTLWFPQALCDACGIDPTEHWLDWKVDAPEESENSGVRPLEISPWRPTVESRSAFRKRAEEQVRNHERVRARAMADDGMIVVRPERLFPYECLAHYQLVEERTSFSEVAEAKGVKWADPKDSASSVGRTIRRLANELGIGLRGTPKGRPNRTRPDLLRLLREELRKQ